jgi:xanthine dehydrogenase accessory factor
VKHECEWDEFLSSAPFRADRTYVSIMTFRHDMDEKILEDILRQGRPTRYLGLIGSQAKWDRFKQRLTHRGLPEAALSRVRSPIGIDVGGKAPQEIAISLAAELLGIYYGKL